MATVSRLRFSVQRGVFPVGVDQRRRLISLFAELQLSRNSLPSLQQPCDQIPVKTIQRICLSYPPPLSFPQKTQFSRVFEEQMVAAFQTGVPGQHLAVCANASITLAWTDFQPRRFHLDPLVGDADESYPVQGRWS